MSERREQQELIDALNDCIDRLAAGESIESCVRRYPQIARDLRVLLESGLLARRVAVSSAELAAAQQRVRARVTQALNTASPKPISRPIWSGLARLIAACVLVVLIGSAGLGALAQNSLPGDALYGVKRLTEAVQITISGDELEAQFAQRRIDEARQLLVLRRVAEVNFTGSVDAVDTFDWQVNGLALRVLPDTVGAVAVEAAQVGTRVEVRALTTEQGELIALEIRRLDADQPQSSPTGTPTTLMSPTFTETQAQRPTRTFTPIETQRQRPTQEITATPTLARVRPTATISPTLQSRPQRDTDIPARTIEPTLPSRGRGGS
ncbi:MAG: hypothetical protein H7175_11450 [Burkholderiales bacterium]|nr:hypothetical protein [Anaerolineae bacterium]